MATIIITALIYLNTGVGILPKEVKISKPKYSQKKFHN